MFGGQKRSALLKVKPLLIRFDQNSQRETNAPPLFIVGYLMFEVGYTNEGQ